MKKWLQGNKIYFETVVSALLGIMAVSVSITSCQIGSTQVQLQQAEMTPFFQVRTNLIINQQTGHFDEKILSVRSIGAPAHNIKLEHYDFLRIAVFNGKKQNTYIPLSGYYNITNSSGNASGEVFTLKGNGNNLKEHQVYKEILNYNLTLSKDLSFDRVSTVSRISFKDKVGNDSEVYFLDDDHVDKEAVSKIINCKKSEPLLDIDNLSLDVITKYISNLKPISPCFIN